MSTGFIFIFGMVTGGTVVGLIGAAVAYSFLADLLKDLGEKNETSAHL